MHYSFWHNLGIDDLAGVKEFLDSKIYQYNNPNFIENDPVCIPHGFSRQQDIEIMGFFAAILAWGQRKTIINKCRELSARMDNAPFDFVMHHRELDLKHLLGFKHRTFNDTDLLYFISFFKYHYSTHASLESAFSSAGDGSSNVESMLNYFRSYFFSLPDFPLRTRKHITAPSQKATCKRLNMFLRWMVRHDDCGVDFGIWKRITPAELMCPCDLHVDRVSRKLKLIQRKQTDWKTVIELTDMLKSFDPLDPVKYDFALFGLGVEEKLHDKLI